MFAPKVAKAQPKAAANSTNKLAPRHSAFATRPFGGGEAEQVRMLQRAIGNQAMLRLLSQQARNLTENGPHGHNEQNASSSSLTVRGATPGVSWDFSKIPIFPPDQADRSQPSSPLAATPLPGAIQAKLVVGQVDDPLEHEADRVADQVMRMPDPALSIGAAPLQISRKCATCEKEDEDKAKLQMKPAAASQLKTGEAPSTVHNVLRSPGRPLDAASRAYFEPRYGCDFSSVRVHDDARAQESARSVHARAYTVGRNIVFAAGAYRPNTTHGDMLLAHELTHVVQQRGASDAQIQRAPDDTAATAAAANGPDQAATPNQTQAPATSDPAQPDAAPPDSAGSNGAPPELANSIAKIEQLKSEVAAVTRDQGPPAPAGRSETGGATVCDPTTGKPKWAVNKGVVPQCLWPCVEVHEQTHAEFMARPCEDVGIAFARIQFWLDLATQYTKQNNPDEAARAIKQLEIAIKEAEQAVARYTKYMDQTCRYDEGMAYDAGIKACDTDDARKRCAAAGQTDEYNKQMAAWRRFMQNPPNCAKPP